MLKILTELGLSEEMAQKVMEAFEKFTEENAEKEEKKESEENKAEIAPMGKTDELVPTKEEFEKMGYLARLELAKTNPEVYERLKNGR